MSNYDVVIAGAGTAGSMAAAALANKGLKVALLDRQSKEKIGVKVCGDATSGEHFKRIKDVTKVDPPKNDENHAIGGSKVEDMYNWVTYGEYSVNS